MTQSLNPKLETLTLTPPLQARLTPRPLHRNASWFPQIRSPLLRVRKHKYVGVDHGSPYFWNPPKFSTSLILAMLRWMEDVLHHVGMPLYCNSYGIRSIGCASFPLSRVGFRVVRWKVRSVLSQSRCSAKTRVLCSAASLQRLILQALLLSLEASPASSSLLPHLAPACPAGLRLGQSSLRSGLPALSCPARACLSSRPPLGSVKLPPLCTGAAVRSGRATVALLYSSRGFCP